MQGRRLYKLENGLFEKVDAATLSPTKTKIGDYWKEDSGVWFCYSPAGIGSLEDHDIVEHEDKTITVSPSILMEGKQYWHGYLEHGVWREA